VGTVYNRFCIERKCSSFIEWTFHDMICFSCANAITKQTYDVAAIPNDCQFPEGIRAFELAVEKELMWEKIQCGHY
jgi:hypothetical protein